MNNICHLIDCNEFMQSVTDKFFELAIVDPQYGIGETWKKNRKGQKEFKGKYKNENPPDDQYFKELFRISKNYIIWGSNFYKQVWPNKNVIIWDKICRWETDHKAEAEIAITNLSHRPISVFKFQWAGGRKGKETGIKIIHPHQKPIALYKWLLKNYAKPGDKIFDSHVGSGSIRIACHDMGFNFTGCEIDKEYFKSQEERFKNHIAQQELFNKSEIQSLIYQG